MQINDPNLDVDYLTYLLKYDSVHQRFKGTIEKKSDGILVNGVHHVKLTNFKDPNQIEWSKTGSEYICESSGVNTSKAKA
jgi:glyceraldehyde 3-phosphate dehydrogenase